MQVCDQPISAPVISTDAAWRPSIVVGITHPQTCLVLTRRLRALREAGFRVILVASPGALLDETAAREGVEQLAIPMRRGIAPFSDVVSLMRLWMAILRIRPDITEFSTPKAGLLGNVVALLCGVPVRIYLLRGLRLETASGIQRRILQMTERLAAACAQRVVCNSKSLLEQALALGIAPLRKLQLLGDGSSDGVDAERFSPGACGMRKQLGLPGAGSVVGFVGRLTVDKGIPELIEAFDALLESKPEARLLLVGWFDDCDDALSDHLRERIARHPKIICTGFVADTAPYYRAMDVMVLPTWREGFPNVVLEAGASGIPVIATLATGSRDAVLPEVTGLLVPPGYPEAITEAMLKLLRDPVRRRRMGAAARAWIVERFVNQRVLGLTIGFYEELLEAADEAHRPSGAKDGAALGAEG